MLVRNHTISVCSWSLHPTGMQDLAQKVQTLGLQHVQLALIDLIQLDDKRKYQELGHLRAAQIGFTGAMMSFPGEDYTTIATIRKTGGLIPDDQWPLRRGLIKEGARLAKEMGIRTITTHVGFVPKPNETGYAEIRDRVLEVAADFASFDVDLLMETGQEPAHELLEFLNDLNASNVHINFDPANMILYGAGDPMEAIKVLGPHIRHVHAKDATPSNKPGEEWGAEVPFGTGRVNPTVFLAALDLVGFTGPIAIEREAGNDRMGDVRVAISALQKA